jgi:hypothetical protein
MNMNSFWVPTGVAVELDKPKNIHLEWSMPFFEGIDNSFREPRFK